MPAIFALGHDAYLYNLNPDRGFLFSSIGYIWTKYLPQSYELFIKTAEPGVVEMMELVMTQTLTKVCAILGLVLPVLVACQYMILRLLFGRIGGASFETYVDDRSDLVGREKGRMIYTRK